MARGRVRRRRRCSRDHASATRSCRCRATWSTSVTATLSFRADLGGLRRRAPTTYDLVLVRAGQPRPLWAPPLDAGPMAHTSDPRRTAPVSLRHGPADALQLHVAPTPAQAELVALTVVAGGHRGGLRGVPEARGAHPAHRPGRAAGPASRWPSREHRRGVLTPAGLPESGPVFARLAVGAEQSLPIRRARNELRHPGTTRCSSPSCCDGTDGERVVARLRWSPPGRPGDPADRPGVRPDGRGRRVRIAFLVFNLNGMGGTSRSVITQANALAGEHEIQLVSVTRSSEAAALRHRSPHRRRLPRARRTGRTAGDRCRPRRRRDGVPAGGERVAAGAVSLGPPVLGPHRRGARGRPARRLAPTCWSRSPRRCSRPRSSSSPPTSPWCTRSTARPPIARPRWSPCSRSRRAPTPSWSSPTRWRRGSQEQLGAALPPTLLMPNPLP